MPSESLLRDMAYFAPKKDYKKDDAASREGGAGASSDDRRSQSRDSRNVHYRTPGKKAESGAKIATPHREHDESRREKARKMAEEIRKLTANKAKLGLTILLCAMAIILIFAAVMSSNQHHEMTREIARIEAKIKIAEQDNEAMRLSFEQKMSNHKVEEYARDVLGMRKREHCQTEWISLQDGDIFAYAPNEDGGGIGEAIDTFMAYLGG